uniref:Uncharacterized protein n=1 Tax=Oryza glumipatula TaxID=40148 RepID=A0A0E0A8L4_9ORYZ
MVNRTDAELHQDLFLPLGANVDDEHLAANPRKYFVQHAARLPYTAAWSSDNVKVIMKASNEANSMDNAGSSRPQLSVTTGK